MLSAYLVGAIPTGYWLCRWLKGINITHHGSGNIGATNVGRILGKPYFIFVFLCDAGKALGVLAAGNWWYQGQHKDILLFSMAAAVLIGNAYSIFIHFNGGKGVATTVGLLGYLYPWPLSVLFAISWLTTLIFFKEAFIATFLAYFLVVITWLIGYTMGDIHGIFLLFLGVWLLLRHWRNIILWLRMSGCEKN